MKLKSIVTSLLCLLTIACARLNDTIAGDSAPVTSTNIEMARSQTSIPFTQSDGVPTSLQDRWIVDATEAKQLIESGAILLDARGRATRGQLQGAIPVSWQEFSPNDAIHRGQLLEDDGQLTEKLQGLGISADTPVVVFSNPPEGWGEDGRIVWMLRTLGHSQAVMVDGGFAALVAANVPEQKDKPLTPIPGDFVVQRNPDWAIAKDQLKEQLPEDDIVIIDSREPREFAGKTPYGERRGGHVPGAVNLYFKDFLQPNGMLLSQPEVLQKLAEVGITQETEVVVYCTGGIRSAWLAAMLVTLGINVRNYAGSMWEWSASPADSYPLE